MALPAQRLELAPEQFRDLAVRTTVEDTFLAAFREKAFVWGRDKKRNVYYVYSLSRGGLDDDVPLPARPYAEQVENGDLDPYDHML